ncbi:MAG: 50S ribosomal protein L9 [Candidatus Taylorbacteria bacterium]|nr:50S ribosomal protein L9 [Candidatus Taylorbacteria bacterium]
MKVILLQNIKGVGRIGDIKNVADGYGRNYLLANKMAKVATDSAIQEVEILKKKGEMEEKIAVEKAKEVAEKAKDITLEFTKKASKTGKLFASLTKEEVAEELSKAVGGKVEPDSIGFKEHGEHIKQAGEHVIEVELAPGIKVELKVVIKG